MKKRLISCFTSDVKAMDSEALKNSIIACAGRVVLGETVVTAPPLIDGITNAEVISAFSADLILLNEYDVLTKFIYGMTDVNKPIEKIKSLTGRPVGINLEPVDVSAQTLENRVVLSDGR